MRVNWCKTQNEINSIFQILPAAQRLAAELPWYWARWEGPCGGHVSGVEVGGGGHLSKPPQPRQTRPVYDPGILTPPPGPDWPTMWVSCELCLLVFALVLHAAATQLYVYKLDPCYFRCGSCLPKTVWSRAKPRQFRQVIPIVAIVVWSSE